MNTVTYTAVLRTVAATKYDSKPSHCITTTVPRSSVSGTQSKRYPSALPNPQPSRPRPKIGFPDLPTTYNLPNHLSEQDDATTALLFLRIQNQFRRFDLIISPAPAVGAGVPVNAAISGPMFHCGEVIGQRPGLLEYTVCKTEPCLLDE
ncbi:MAG: hypothetical protein MMC23_001284 [Stictis urceolatum]|nr:hypothetical protein [Stictis urceolata]